MKVQLTNMNRSGIIFSPSGECMLFMKGELLHPLQISSIIDVTGVAGTGYESARAITLSKMAETKIRNHMHIFIC